MENISFSFGPDAQKHLAELGDRLRSPAPNVTLRLSLSVLDELTEALEQGGTVHISSPKDSGEREPFTLEMLRGLCHHSAAKMAIAESVEDDAARSAVPLWLAKLCQLFRRR